MKKFCAALVLAGFVGACSDPQTAIRAAENIGLTDVQPNGYRWFGCSKDDQFHTGFTAKNVQGKQMSGVVCSSWLKGATVRFD